MTTIAQQATTGMRNAEKFMENITVVTTSHVKRGGRALVPVNEKPPRMWAIMHAYTPFQGGQLLTRGGNARASDGAVTNDQRVMWARSALTTLLLVIANTTADLGENEAIPTSTTAAWCTFICTFARLIFVSPLDKADVGASEMNLPEAESQRLADYYDELCSFASNEVGACTAAEIQAMGEVIATRLSLPVPGIIQANIATLIISRDTAKEEPAFYALVVYMAGRAITVQTPNAVHVTRPRNLQQKFNEGATWGTIGGEAKMSRGAYVHIAKAWLMNTTMRFGLLVPLITLEAGEAYVTGNIVFTLFKLLRGAGMAHVGIIFEFLRRYPWVADMEEVSSELFYLALHSQALKTTEDALRPYYKLLYADSTNYFDSRTLTKLTGLAVSVLSRTTQSLAHYAHTQDSTLLARFDELDAAGL